MVDYAMLEHAIRDDLNQHAPRAMAVIRPLKITVTNYPENRVEEFEIPTYPQDKENNETRIVPFSREVYIEQDDYMENAPKKFFRLTEGREVRLLGAYLVTCTEAIKDEAGNVVELKCTYDPESRGGFAPDGRKVKGTIHWVSGEHAVDAELRLYNPLFTVENPEADGDFLDVLNPDSVEIIPAKVEPTLAETQTGQAFQFMRQGYFVADSKDHTPEKPVFNRTVTLRDSWAKAQKKSN
jgi:glutaminyl-tRNA synthetase